MKQKVAITAIAVIISVLLLLPLSPIPVAARGVYISSCSIYPEINDYRSSFTFIINLTNPSSSALTGEFSLIVGPDYTDKNISKEWNLTQMVSSGICGNLIIVPAYGSSTVTKEDVYFLEPELSQGAFSEWIHSSGEPFEWDKTWCIARFKSWPFETTSYKEKRGIPILTTLGTKFYSSNVRYNESACPDKLSFDYEVDVWLSENRSVELQVFNNSPYAPSDWETKRVAYCTRGRHNLEIHDVPLTRHNLDDKNEWTYRFKSGGVISLQYLGINVGAVFSTPTVEPQEGTNNDSFSYSITVRGSTCDMIELQVKNHTTGEWNTKGVKSYLTPGTEQTFVWRNISLNAHELNRRNDARFRLMSVVTGKQSNERELPIWPIAETWRCPLVEPETGLYNSAFNYSLEVKADKEVNVTLVVFYPSGKHAPLKSDTRRYTDVGTWQRLYWNVTQPFEEEAHGKTSYKFIFYYHNEEINDTEYSAKRFDGPYVAAALFRNQTVKPELALCTTNVTYSVEIKSVKASNPILEVRDSDGTIVTNKEHKERTTTEWSLSTFENVTFVRVPPASLGNAYYSFKCGLAESERYEGPELIKEEFGRLLAEPCEGTHPTIFNVSSVLSTSKPQEVSLWARCDDGDWQEVACEPAESEQEIIAFTAQVPSEQYKTVCWKCKALVQESEVFCTSWEPKSLNLQLSNNATVPTEGVYATLSDYSVNNYQLFQINHTTPFIYTITATANKPTTLKLMLISPRGKAILCEDEYVYTTPPHSLVCSWNLLGLPYGSLGRWNYTFLYHDPVDGWREYNQTFQGPELVAVFRKYTISPKPPIRYGDPVTVTLWMNATKEMELSLEAFNVVTMNWTHIGVQQYEPSGEKALSWCIETLNVPFKELRLKWS
jgi:hypothetical protein